MSEERMRILNMIAQGKITPEEGEQLLEALKSEEVPRPQTTLAESLEKKFFYVLVEPKGEENKERVSVKIPFALLKAGLNISGLIPKEAQEKINTAMSEKGVSFDLNSLKPENIQELLGALEQLTVDVESDDATVKVYCR